MNRILQGHLLPQPGQRVALLASIPTVKYRKSQPCTCPPASPVLPVPSFPLRSVSSSSCNPVKYVALLRLPPVSPVPPVRPARPVYLSRLSCLFD
ncbi:MAG: hypothetical protein IJ879_01760 [Muribaculaceae bacterium]|nr:hypothetical protein [Muribaculaceae bacterium]